MKNLDQSLLTPSAIGMKNVRRRILVISPEAYNSSLGKVRGTTFPVAFAGRMRYFAWLRRRGSYQVCQSGVMLAKSVIHDAQSSLLSFTP